MALYDQAERDANERAATKARRIARLRVRLKQIEPADDALIGVLNGVLDLLADEL